MSKHGFLVDPWLGTSEINAIDNEGVSIDTVKGLIILCAAFLVSYSTKADWGLIKWYIATEKSRVRCKHKNAASC